MALDIRGSLKNTKPSANAYVVFDELISNSIDSFLIRKKVDPEAKDLEIELSVEFYNKDLEGREVGYSVTCTDNGVGFSTDQINAFITKDTSYKDDLDIPGIGKCKGSGRIQYLHYFSKMDVSSVSNLEGKSVKYSLSVHEGTKLINEESFKRENLEALQPPTTTFHLDVLKEEAFEKFLKHKDVKKEFSPKAMREHIIMNTLQRLVSLEHSLGDFKIKFKSIDNGVVEEEILVRADLPKVFTRKKVDVDLLDADGKSTGGKATFEITQYKLKKEDFKLKSNLVALCAKSSTVKNITTEYLKSKTVENNAINGFYHIILVEGDFLDIRVNERRDNFNIRATKQDTDFYISEDLTWDRIHDKIDPIIEEMITPPDWSKEELVQQVGRMYGISENMLKEANVRIRYSDSEESVVKRVLVSYTEQIIKDTGEIFELKEEIKKLNPTSPEFREKISEISWKVTTSLKYVDMANLSQLIIRRSAIIEALSKAIIGELEMQKLPKEEGKKDNNEKIIHNIFFPQYKDSSEFHDHDIWLLSEEYQYYDYIASDKQLSKIQIEDSTFLFSSDIDKEVEAVFKRTTQDNSAKRPDIAIFSKEGAAIIIELKAPGVYLDEHVNDLMEYAQLLAAKSNGKINKFYGYLIGTDWNENRFQGYTQFPTTDGWFGTFPVRQPNTAYPVGELYSEVLTYESVVERASKRIRIYQEKLKLKEIISLD